MRRKVKKAKASQETGDRQGLWFWATLALTLVILVALLAVSCGSRPAGSDPGVAQSLKKRTKLADGIVTETGYYTDNLNWLGKNNSRVLKGLRYFYRQTGVQPYVYLTNNLGLGSAVPSRESLAAFAETLYDTLFQDEGHLLLVIYVNAKISEEPIVSCVTGVSASAVADQEAEQILEAYLSAAMNDADRYPSGAQDQMLSDVFRHTAENIMSVSDRTGWIAALSVILILFALIILVDFGRAWSRQKKERLKLEKELAKEEEAAADRP